MNKFKHGVGVVMIGMALGLITGVVSGLSGCNKESVSIASLEEAKQTARDNTMFNAQMYRQSNPLYQDWSIIPSGDSSQTDRCPQGDGWATVKFLSPKKDNQTAVKCSTFSLATGCLIDSEFKSKPFAGDDGHCQPTNKVPYPLPKIGK